MSFQRIGMAALAFCAVFSVSLAQDSPPPGGGQGGPGGPGQRRQPMMQTNWKELTSKLNLSDDQVTKLKDAIKSHMDQMKSLRDSGKTREENQAAAKSAQESFKTAVKGILSDSQFKQLEEMGGPRRLMGGPPSPLEMLSSLGLTDEQKAKAKAVFDEERKSSEALRSDDAISPEDRRTKMQAIHKDSMEKLKGILTDEQFTKLQKMMQRGPGGRGGRGGPGGPGGGAPGGPPPGEGGGEI